LGAHFSSQARGKPFGQLPLPALFGPQQASSEVTNESSSWSHSVGLSHASMYTVTAGIRWEPKLPRDGLTISSGISQPRVTMSAGQFVAQLPAHAACEPHTVPQSASDVQSGGEKRRNST
jgi:hypothetical protein